MCVMVQEQKSRIQTGEPVSFPKVTSRPSLLSLAKIEELQLNRLPAFTVIQYTVMFGADPIQQRAAIDVLLGIKN